MLRWLCCGYISDALRSGHLHAPEKAHAKNKHLSDHNRLWLHGSFAPVAGSARNVLTASTWGSHARILPPVVTDISPTIVGRRMSTTGNVNAPAHVSRVDQIHGTGGHEITIPRDRSAIPWLHISGSRWEPCVRRHARAYGRTRALRSKPKGHGHPVDDSDNFVDGERQRWRPVGSTAELFPVSRGCWIMHSYARPKRLWAPRHTHNMTLIWWNLAGGAAYRSSHAQTRRLCCVQPGIFACLKQRDACFSRGRRWLVKGGG